MSQINVIAQPMVRTTLDAIEAILKSEKVFSVNIAAAYITSSGICDLLGRIESALGTEWATVEKRWITSFDYCRTQPVALKILVEMPKSSVRIYDAAFCLTHGGMPKIPFHPKAFLFRGTNTDFILAGSGNLSRSGLSRGVEVGLAIAVHRKGPAEPTAAASIKALEQWYDGVWKGSDPLNTLLLKQYIDLFESVPNLAHPVPTEDDLASSELIKGALTNKDLQKLRVCRNLWIEAGNITKNRGPTLPGNQLMMKRLSRVYFGYNPDPVPENTVIGGVNLAFDGGAIASYTLSYSDNKMDKLNLPMPGITGPAAYDNEFLLFQEVAPHLYNLKVGTKAEKAAWVRSSKAIDAHFKMSSGREWGVF